MIIIPQSMAYATLANLDPVYGLYASFIPVAIAFFGSSRYLARTCGNGSLITAVAITSLSLGDKSLYLPLAIMLALSVGIFQLTLALVKAGKLIDVVLKEHVILGFTSRCSIDNRKLTT